MSKRKQILRLVLTGAVLLWMGVIFFMSAQPAETSADLSGGISGMVQRIFFRNWKELSEYDFVLHMTSLDYLIRKAAHFTEYAILGGLLSAALYQWFPKFRVSVWYAGILGMMYAITDEFHQHFVEGRSMQVFDVCVDTIGVCVGAVVVCGIMAMVLYAKLREAESNVKRN